MPAETSVSYRLTDAPSSPSPPMYEQPLDRAETGERRELTRSEIAQALSLATGLLPDNPQIVGRANELAGVINSSPALRGLRPGDPALQAYLGQNLQGALQIEIERVKASRAADASAAESAGVVKSSAVGIYDFARRLRWDGEASGEARESSARFGALSQSRGDFAWLSTPEGRAMSAYARTVGLGWATAVPEVLRMGKDAIKALADAHLRGDVYKGLRDTAGFEKEHVVAFAKAAKEKNVDANELGRRTIEASKDLNVDEKPLHRDSVMGLVTAPRGEAEAAAWAHYKDTNQQLREAHPDSTPALNKEQEFMRDNMISPELAEADRKEKLQAARKDDAGYDAEPVATSQTKPMQIATVTAPTSQPRDTPGEGKKVEAVQKPGEAKAAATQPEKSKEAPTQTAAAAKPAAPKV